VILIKEKFDCAERKEVISDKQKLDYENRKQVTLNKETGLCRNDGSHIKRTEIVFCGEDECDNKHNVVMQTREK
jgi:hypothetical protein